MALASDPASPATGVTRETNLPGDGPRPPPRRAQADDRVVAEADRLWQQEHTGERLFLIALANGGE